MTENRMSDIDTDFYSATMVALAAQRAAYADYRLIVEGLQIAVERPSRRVVPYLAEQLANTAAEIEARWTELLAAHRTMSQEADGPLAKEVREFSSLVVQDAERASGRRWGRHRETWGAGIRMELRTDFQTIGVGPLGTDVQDPDIRTRECS